MKQKNTTRIRSMTPQARYKITGEQSPYQIKEKFKKSILNRKFKLNAKRKKIGANLDDIDRNLTERRKSFRSVKKNKKNGKSEILNSRQKRMKKYGKIYKNGGMMKNIFCCGENEDKPTQIEIEKNNKYSLIRK